MNTIGDFIRRDRDTQGVKEMNKVMLLGRLTQEVVTKEIGEEREAPVLVLNNTLAVRNVYKKRTEDRATQFIPIVAWGKLAKRIEDYVKKGDRIAVEGYLQTRSYTNKSNQYVFVVEVVVEEVYFVEQNKSDENEKLPFEID